jgi:hypothetical protein
MPLSGPPFGTGPQNSDRFGLESQTIESLCTTRKLRVREPTRSVDHPNCTHPQRALAWRPGPPEGLLPHSSLLGSAVDFPEQSANIQFYGVNVPLPSAVLLGHFAIRSG